MPTIKKSVAVKVLQACGLKTASNHSVESVEESINQLDRLITPEAAEALKDPKESKMVSKVLIALEDGLFTVTDDGDATEAEATEEDETKPTTKKRRVKKSKPTEAEAEDTTTESEEEMAATTKVRKRVKAGEGTTAKTTKPTKKPAAKTTKPTTTTTKKKPTKPEAEEAKPTKKKTATAKSEPKESNVEKDAYGTRVGTTAHVINNVILSYSKRQKWSPADLGKDKEVAKLRAGRVRDHLQSLVRKGLVERNAGQYQRVS